MPAAWLLNDCTRRLLLNLRLCDGPKTGTSCLARVSLAPSVTTAGIALLDVPHLADGRYQHAFAFEPRQQRADALMDAAAEAKAADRTPRDVVFVLPRPSARIAVGATEKHQHLETSKNRVFGLVRGEDWTGGQ